MLYWYNFQINVLLKIYQFKTSLSWRIRALFSSSWYLSPSIRANFVFQFMRKLCYILFDCFAFSIIIIPLESPQWLELVFDVGPRGVVSNQLQWKGTQAGLLVRKSRKSNCSGKGWDWKEHRGVPSIMLLFLDLLWAWADGKWLSPQIAADPLTLLLLPSCCWQWKMLPAIENAAGNGKCCWQWKMLPAMENAAGNGGSE